MGGIGPSYMKLMGLLAPSLMKKAAGTVFTNIKSPRQYTLPAKKNLAQYGKNLLALEPDKPVWTDEIGNTEVDPSNILPARDFIFRKEFGMSDDDANRFGGKDVFNETGKNSFTFNTNNSVGRKQQDMIDKQAQDFMKHKMETATRDGWTPENMNPEPLPTFKDSNGSIIPQTQYPRTLKTALLGNIGMEQLGEGEDENGYFVKVGGKDVWDFGLHDNEKLLDLKNPKQSLINMLRTGLDNIIDPATINYESKVYMPGIKKQPRRKKVAPGVIMDADRY